MRESLIRLQLDPPAQLSVPIPRLVSELREEEEGKVLHGEM